MNGRAPKRKGTAFERELVHLAKAAGLSAKRAYASNGEALGLTKEVDLTVGGYRVQAKRRKTLPSYLYLPEDVDAVALRADRGEALVVIRFAELLHLLGNEPTQTTIVGGGG